VLLPDKESVVDGQYDYCRSVDCREKGPARRNRGLLRQFQRRRQAESDICCTSGNAVKVVQSLGKARLSLFQTNTSDSGSPKKPAVICFSGQAIVHPHENIAGNILNLKKSIRAHCPGSSRVPADAKAVC